MSKHLDSEFLHLTQVNILEEDMLILLSEEVIIMFDCFHAIQRKRMALMVNALQMEYMDRCIWISMQVHMAMDEFTQNGMKYNSSILAAFMCFLTKVMGGNAAAGVSGSIAALKAKLKNLDTTLKEVKKKAAAATTRANKVNNTAKDAKAKLAKLYQVNSTLKKGPQVASWGNSVKPLCISSCISLVQRSVCIPGGFVVVAQHWPGSLISILVFDLTLLAGFFPNKFHGYFNSSKSSIAQWCSTWDFCGPSHVSNAYMCCLGDPISCSVFSQRCWVVGM